MTRFLNKIFFFLKLSLNYDKGDNDVISTGSVGLSRPSSQENVQVMLKTNISELYLQVKKKSLFHNKHAH